MDARGHIHQLTDADGIDAAAAKGGLTAYVGYDMTAASLHVGNLATIMLLRRLQQAGGKPIVLLGGGTTRIGDPSGKDTQRQMLDDAAIAALSSPRCIDLIAPAPDKLAAQVWQVPPDGSAQALDPAHVRSKLRRPRARTLPMRIWCRSQTPPRLRRNASCWAMARRWNSNCPLA
jgi:hypothetical protein